MGDDMEVMKRNTIRDRQSEYQQRQHKVFSEMTPARADPFADTAPDANARTYADVMAEAQLARDEATVKRNIERKQKEEAEKKQQAEALIKSAADKAAETRKRRRWDDTTAEGAASGGSWDSTPQQVGAKASRWDSTPAPAGSADGASMSTPSGKRSRWDVTPAAGSSMMTPGATPVGNLGMATPSQMTPDQIMLARLQQDVDERNRPLTDEELDELMPKEGYEILTPPANYKPILRPAVALMATPTPLGQSMYQIPAEQKIDLPPEIADLPFTKPEDVQFFGKLLDNKDEDTLSPEEQKERRIMKLLLKVKNGTPPQRKTALRQLTDKARWFGPGPLFNQILPLLMAPTLEDQERHLLVKVVDRVLYKLDDLVRPFAHKILVVIEPLLIDEDYYARVEGREIISNLAKAAGLATMIATMRPDIDHVDEYVRNTTARAFAVVASALGIHSLLPFLKAVCQSKKSWQARHTGIKIVQQIAILMGCAVLPHLKSLVDIIEKGLEDEQSKV